MSRDRQAIEELSALLDGRVSADSAEAPLRRLASLATAVAEHSHVPAMDAAARDRLRTEVVAAAAAANVTWLDRARDAFDARTAQLRYSVRAAVAAGTASTMLGTVGVAAASQAALPGDVLYPVKQGTESVRLWLADGLVESGRLHLAFARERLEEIEAGTARLDVDTVIATLDEMDDEAVLGANDLLDAYHDTGDTELLTTLADFTTEQTDRLSEVAPLLPVDARSFVERSLEVLRRIEVQVATIGDACATCATEPAVATSPISPALPSAPSVTLPGDGTAVAHQACDCVSPSEPAPPRDPAPAPEPQPQSPPPGGAEPEPEPEPQPEPDDDDVPELPGPLDPVGDEVDDVIDELEDTVDDVLPPAPEATTDDGTLDGTDTSLTEPLEDTVDSVESTVDSVGDTVTSDPSPLG